MNQNTMIKDKRPPTTRDQSILQQSTILEIPIAVSNTANAILTVRKQENSKVAAQRFCFDNNLQFKLIHPISKRIELLLQADDLDDCEMKHISLDDCQQSNIQNVTIKRKQQVQLNPGVLMYERNRRLSELSKKKNKILQETLQLQKTKSFTFKPEINHLSKIVVEQIQQAQGREQFYERRKQQRMSKIYHLQKSKDKQQMKQCTFKPTTNSMKFSSLKTIPQTVYLNNLAKPKNYESNKREKSFCFQPRINQISQMIVNGVSFQQRQQKYEYDKMMRRSASIRQSTQSLRSSRHTNDKFTQKRNLEKLPVGQYLYNQRYNKQLKVQKIKEQLQTSQAKAGMKSSKIYETNKYKSFIQIFRTLDSNDDSIISASKIQTKTLPSQILALIAPLLAQMEEMKIELTQEEFIQALDKLYSTLNVGERNHFLKFARSDSKQKQQRYPFKPIIDQKSNILASKVRQFNTPGVSLYNFCQQRKSLLDRKLQQRRREKQNNQIRGCTFCPVINT